jgi:hypothetical protein
MLSTVEADVLAAADGGLSWLKSFHFTCSDVNGYGVRTMSSGIDLRGAFVSIGGGINCTDFFVVAVAGDEKFRWRGLLGSRAGGNIELRSDVCNGERANDWRLLSKAFSSLINALSVISCAIA